MRTRKRSTHTQTMIVLQGKGEPFYEFEARINGIMAELQAKLEQHQPCIPLPCCASDGRMTMTIVYDAKIQPAVKSKSSVVATHAKK